MPMTSLVKTKQIISPLFKCSTSTYAMNPILRKMYVARKILLKRGFLKIEFRLKKMQWHAWLTEAISILQNNKKYQGRGRTAHSFLIKECCVSSWRCKNNSGFVYCWLTVSVRRPAVGWVLRIMHFLNYTVRVYVKIKAIWPIYSWRWRFVF